MIKFINKAIREKAESIKQTAKKDISAGYFDHAKEGIDDLYKIILELTEE